MGITFKHFFVESTKFFFPWQLVRTKAKEVKDPQEKLNYVLKFLNDHPSPGNYQRVLNWVRMTAAGYKAKAPAVAASYERNADKLVSNASSYASEVDDPEDLSKVSTEDLQKVYKDLRARKYGFQYKSIPKAHTEYLKALEQELAQRV